LNIVKIISAFKVAYTQILGT